MPKAMHVLKFSIAFAFEIKIIGRNRHKSETIVITSDLSTCGGVFLLPLPMHTERAMHDRRIICPD